MYARYVQQPWLYVTVPSGGGTLTFTPAPQQVVGSKAIFAQGVSSFGVGMSVSAAWTFLRWHITQQDGVTVSINNYANPMTLSGIHDARVTEV